jgi:Tol biopolymer transport system component
MTRKWIVAVALLLTLPALACSLDLGGANKPTVEILSPPSGTQVTLADEVEVQYRATDPVAVVRVELEAGGDVVDLQDSPVAAGQPSMTGILRWTPAEVGRHTLLVYAYNADRAASDAVGVEIIVVEASEPAPLPSPTPTVEQATPTLSGPMLTPLPFEEDFSDPRSGWEAGESAYGSVGYRDGVYYVISLQHGHTVFGLANRLFGDMVIELDATQVSAPPNNNNDYGVVCRAQPDGSGYFLLTTGDQYFGIWKRTSSGEYESLVPWTKSDVIRPGNATNHIRAVCDGPTLQLYVNGELLGDTTDSSYTQGDIALEAETYEEEPTEVHFDNLLVTAPTPRIGPAPTLPSVAQATTAPAGPARIAFVSTRDGNEEIYSMNPDGSGVTRLTSSSGADLGPVWSPDGRRIAFESYRDGNSEIYVINADGSGLTRLANHPADDSNPTWSPDGQRIAFASMRDGNNEIYVMKADGSGVTRLTNNSAIDYEPSWSPDGTRIAFMSRRDGNNEIYTMNTDGSGQTRLTNNNADDWDPTWSPDGRRIAFVTYRGGNNEIFVMNADGSGQANLTNSAANDRWPSWSPDGTHIVFTSYSGGNDEIFAMNADGTGQTNLTNYPATDQEPSWSPR